MIIAVLILFGILLGVLASELINRATARDANPMLDRLRASLDDMKRDYRLRVTTEELTRELSPRRPPEGP